MPYQYVDHSNNSTRGPGHVEFDRSKHEPTIDLATSASAYASLLMHDRLAESFP